MNRILHILYQPYKWLFFIPFISMATLFFGVLAVFFSYIFHPKVGSYVGGKLWARFIGILTPVFVKVRGREHIQKNQSYIIVSNHLSMYDIFILYGWLNIDIRWIMKKELRRVPGVGMGSEKVGHIFIDRSHPRAAIESVKKAKDKIKDGTSLVIFPEGTRSKTGKTGVFKKGAFKIAFDLNLPVLPVTVKGTNKILPAGTLNLLPGKAEIIIHKPINTGNINYRTGLTELSEKTREIIVKAMAE